MSVLDLGRFRSSNSWSKQAASPLTPIQQSGLEMFQRASVQQPFFKARTTAPPRPFSEATDMYDTEFEEDADEDDSNSPRTSIESLGKTSDSTVSSYEELLTPTSNHYAAFDFQLDHSVKPVEGPKGPHLFRASQDSSRNLTFQLSLSPLTPKDPTPRPATAFRAPSSPLSANIRPLSTLTEAVARLETAQVRSWSPSQVAAWMYEAGFEEAVVDKFKRNDISGAILVDLKFEDLKELDIQSFGKRHRLWTEIHNLQRSPLSSPVDTSRPSSHESGASPRHRRHGDCSPADDEDRPELRRHRSRRHRRPHPADDSVISPAESVSIVGIEQLIPKPHKCSKGERCAKYRKQQRQWAQLTHDHPISPTRGGTIVISGDPGNASTAESALRPISEAEPSVVASSDVLGPGQLPEFKLAEESLRTVQLRDPQENVKQFLNFQHLQEPPIEEPCSPPAPLELFPPLHPPARAQPVNENLKSLPKLTIPPTRAATTTTFSPSRTITPSNIYRRGTPCSEMDVPVTAIPLGPVARDFSQSVPPDMRYRRGSPVTAGGRSESRHPSFGLMAKVDEDVIWEPVDGPEDPMSSGDKDFNHAGYMKKRKTKFLRHEWQEHHFRLKGTRLAMHHDAKTIDELEHIDVDDYAVACSSLASNKLSAALKSMKLSGRKEGGDAAAAFAFQLVPAAEKKGVVKQAALGKTHHFAVKSRDQRIDWMRELMLAKALKQKGDGYEINMNGNMI
ncbi:MAG: hypothetical protein M1837_003872 [Sclerophora amabilis]|nr:MAG: hypothetical protein M1837_003872 [Sclerophora amabilis]